MPLKSSIPLKSLCFFGITIFDGSQGWEIHFSYSPSYGILFAALFWVVFFSIIIINYTSIKKYLSKSKIWKCVKGVVYALPIQFKISLFVYICIFSFNFSYDLILYFYCLLPSINFILPSINFTLPCIDFSALSYSVLQDSLRLYIYAFYQFDYELMGPETYSFNSHFSVSETVCMATPSQGGSSNTAPVSSDTAPVSYEAVVASPNHHALEDITRDFYVVRQDAEALISRTINRLPTPGDQAHHREVLSRTATDFEDAQRIGLGNNAKGHIIIVHESCSWKLGYVRRELSTYLDHNDLNQIRLMREAISNSLQDVKNWRP